ncbi:MAG: hypothetical protein V2I33_17660 [Kangiellaceae bacterium]|jgi:hypothetical protein|nr:hypothetical protein [Kangiellaceae bacterium]
MVDLDVSEEFIQRLPYGIAFPILEILRHLRLNPPAICSTWSQPALHLISRDDIYLNRREAEAKTVEVGQTQQYEQLMALELHRENGSSGQAKSF